VSADPAAADEEGAMPEVYRNLVDLRERAKEEVSKVVLGQDRAVDLLLVAALARGHVLLEGPPGSAKTLMGRAIAHMLGASFNRIQFNPDTTPTELVGAYVEKSLGERVYEPGVVYTNVLLADEINRTPPRTQSALLEAMQERQVTVEGRSHKLKDPFLVIATQNANEFEGVYRLPESQLDRFLFKVELEYADEKAELGMLDLPHDGLMPDMIADIHPMLGVVGLEKARYELNATVLPVEVARYIVAVGRRTREIPGVQLGASSRSLIHLASASKAIARLAGRDTVSEDDVREIAPYVIRHRLIVDPRVDPNDVLDDALESSPLPERELTLALC
jgi:MoxR-like ATPase